MLKMKNSSFTISTFRGELSFTCSISPDFSETIFDWLRASFYLLNWMLSLQSLELKREAFEPLFEALKGILLTACNLITKVVPQPIPLLSTLTLPPIFSMRCLQILNPNPVPVLLRPSSSASLLKFKNSLPQFSFDIPRPESLILISKET